jgi:hypothetical protein
VLPPFPYGVEELYDVTFESPVNKMQDSRTLVNLNKFIQTVIPLVQNDPDAFNIIDVGKLTPHLSSFVSLYICAVHSCVFNNL